MQEKRRVYESVGKIARNAGRVHIATIAPQSTDEAINLVRDLETLPVDAAMIFPPLLFAWGKVEGELKFRFFEDLTRSTNLPLVLFQIPVKSYWYDVETICRIAKLESRRLQGSLLRHETFHGHHATTGAPKRNHGSPHRQRSLRCRELSPRRCWCADRRVERCDGKVGAMDIAGRAGDFDKAVAIQNELASLKELIFSEPIVDAVARIKIILQHEGLIKTATVRRPQLGIGESEKTQLLDSYRALTENEFAPSRKALQQSTFKRRVRFNSLPFPSAGNNQCE